MSSGTQVRARTPITIRAHSSTQRSALGRARPVVGPRTITNTSGTKRRGTAVRATDAVKRPGNLSPRPRSKR
jgi:hypothetical protein